MAETDVRAALQEPLWSCLSERLAAQMGLHYPKERWDDLERGIAAAAPAFGMASVESCARWLLSAPLVRHQVEILARHLTVGETYFFREKRTFEILEAQILPELLRARAGTQRLRIWSAGCCTGEEPYSIAILLARLIPDLRNWNISILATDIDPDFLRKASLGIYGDWSFRDSPPGIKERFFRKTREGRFEVAPHVKALVKFAYHNLAQDSYPSVENGTNAMDVVFCRNVLMYFELEHAKRVLQQLSHSLLEDGWLFINPVEIPQVALPQLVPVNFPGLIAHRKSSSLENVERVAVANLPYMPIEQQIPAVPIGLHLDELPAAAFQPKPQLITETPARLEPPPAEVPIRAPLQEASALYGQGRYADAAREIHEVLSKTPGDAAAMAFLARTYANQGRLEDALTWCRQAIAVDKLNAGWCYLLATILQEHGLAEDAATALRRALYLDQDNALVHFALGNLIRRQGKARDSERHFRNALSILRGFRQEQVLPESEGMTAGRLAEIIQSALACEARA